MAENPGVTATVETGKPAHLTLDELSNEQLSKFELTGELPTRGAPVADEGGTDQAEHDAEAAAAKPVEQAASTDASSKAATEAADLGKRKPGQKKNARERAEEIEREAAEDEARLQRALARRREVRESLAAAEREDSSPSKRADAPREAAARTAEEPDWKRYRNLPDAPKPPKMDDFKGIDEFMEAVHEHSAAMAHFVAGKIAEEKFEALSRGQSEAAVREQEFVSRVERAAERITAELEADPTLVEQIPDKWKALNPSDRRSEGEPMTPAHFVKDQVTDSENPLKLSAWLCADNYRELRRIAQLSPQGIIRAIAIQDAKLSAGESDPGEAAGERQHKRVSQAPPPVAGLSGKKAAAGVDPLKQAIAENDFDAFNAMESERERKGRG